MKKAYYILTITLTIMLLSFSCRKENVAEESTDGKTRKRGEYTTARTFVNIPVNHPYLFYLKNSLY